MPDYSGILTNESAIETARGNRTLISGSDAESGNGRNGAVWMVTWNYTVVRSAPNANGTGSGASSVQREAAQSLGRPYTRMAPPIGPFLTTFADKTLDSRYDGTFATVYRGNWPKGGTPNAVLYNANDLPVVPGDPIITFLEDESQTPNIVYPGGGSFPGSPLRSRTKAWSWLEASSSASSSVSPAMTVIAAIACGLSSAAEGRNWLR